MKVLTYKDVTKIQTRQIKAMGTTIDLLLPNGKSEEIFALMEKRIRDYEKRYSANDPSSELGEVNRNAGKNSVQVNKELYDLIKLGKKHSLEKGSHLNIAIGPLVQTWRIGFKDAKVPDEKEIKEVMALTDVTQIKLDDLTHSVFLLQKGMKIDLGSLAKGYIADLLVAELKALQVPFGLINLGGNILTFGESVHEDHLWRIGIQDPLQSRNHLKGLIQVKNKSVVTSGIYERTLTVGQHVYHHIFDPLTGYPVETPMASLTIVSDTSVAGEIWTTRLFGAENVIETVNQVSHIECLVILKNGQEFFSKNMPRYL